MISVRSLSLAPILIVLLVLGPVQTAFAFSFSKPQKPETGVVTVNTDDLPFHYELWKAKNANTCRRPLVLLGGLPTDTIEDGRAYAATLSKDRDVLLVDVRGVGKTDEGPTPGDYSLAQFNVDTQNLISQIWSDDTDKQPVIVGCSDRGKIALQVGLTAAQRISGVITCGASAGGATQFDGPQLLKRNTFLTEGTWFKKSKDYAAVIAGPKWNKSPLAQIWRALLFGKFQSIEGVKRHGSLLTTNVGGVQFISDPTLVLHGNADTLYLPATGSALAAAIGANASFQSMKGAHAFWLTDPSGFMRTIETWVEEEVDTCTL